MELKSLILGVLFTLSIFAVKSGIGLFYVINSNLGKKKVTVLATLLSYALLFLLTFYINKSLNIIEYFSAFENILKTGMIVHLVLAIGMIWWGVHILSKTSENTKGYLMLIFPCPFCLIVVFLCSSFLYKYFVNCNLKITMLFFLSFTFIQCFTVVILYLFKKTLNFKYVNNLLGYSLISIGIFFLLTYCFAPVFSDIDKVFRISSYSGSGFVFSRHTLYFIIISLIIVLTGFLKRKAK